jgi:hypothetical protein
VAFRGDAAFTKPELYEAFEERDVQHAIRLPGNDNLQWNIRELLTRPVGRPSHKPVFRFNSFLYQRATWTIARPVVAKVEFLCGELFTRVGCIVTNLALANRAAVRFYSKRGTAEQSIKEAKQAVVMRGLAGIASAPMKCGSGWVSLPITSGICGGGWRCRCGSRHLVADQLAATFGEDRWAVDKAHTLLLRLLAESHLTPRRLFASMLAKIAILPSPVG